MESKKISKNSKKLIIFSSILFLILLTSLIFYFVELKSYRKVFIFQCIDDDKTHFEVRYLPKVDKEQQIKQYIDDLLLGPINDRYRPLFPAGTKINSCFVRDKKLYIDLSEEALLQEGISSETKIAVELLKLNITKNFNGIDDVILFMMGQEVYTQDSVE